MADFGLTHSLFLYINKTAFKNFGAIDKFLFENFPTWFNIKKENKITDVMGQNFFSNLLKECISFQLIK